MPLCGFNQKMLDGLLAFNQGLAEHGLIERSQIKQRSVDDMLDAELSDMARFLGESSQITDSALRKLVEGLTTYAQGMYELMQRNNVAEYQRIAQRINILFKSMDAKYYSELEGKPEDMKNLVAYLNEQHI